MNIDIQWPEWDQLLNPHFVPLMDNRDRYLICFGGRGSGKSVAVATKLIYRCLTEKNFRYLLIRREYSTIKESSYQTLKDLIIKMGLGDLFEFRVSPLEIICKDNGNRFIARGCDESTKLKSVREVCGAWYEEDLVSEADFITITTSIRTTEAEYLQEIFSINPEVPEDYHEHWFWKRFFEGHPDQLSFKGDNYTVHHSTYKDNQFLTPEFIASLEAMKKSNPYYYQIYCLGLWGSKVLGGTFFSKFTMANTAKTQYDPSLALIVSFDFNTMPGVSCGIFQMQANRTLVMVGEIQLKSPNNNTPAVCRELCRKYNDHEAGMFITGDSSGKSNDSKTEKGFNHYTIILSELKQFMPRDVVPKINPPVSMSARFINSIFEAGDAGYKGCRLVVGDHCQKMIADLMNLLEDSDGTALKKRVTDKNTGQTYEQYGHFGDLYRYAIVYAFGTDFKVFLRGGRTGLNITVGKREPSKYSY
jgi:phage terminase large subunit